MHTRQSALRIAVASGKGGTGKTTVATSLAAVLAREGRQVAYMDGDVEAPNGHLFLAPVLGGELPVELPVPEIDAEQCTACGRCAEICEYGALIALGERILVFPELCHGCGGCRLVCPENAVRETGRRIGVVEEGEADAIHFIRGRLDIGRALSPPVIRAASRRLPSAGIQLIDAPPGTACAAVQAVEGADYVVLVAEPTPFGAHDFELSAEMLRLLERPFGAVINRADEGTGAFRERCAEEGIDVLLELPEDRRIAEACSRGELVVEALPEYRSCFAELFARIEEKVAA